MPFAHLPDGLKLYYEDCCFSDPWRTPQTVILHHGLAKNSRHWYPWVPLVARHHRAIRFDARGFGKSSIPAPGHPWSLESFADDIARLMDCLGIESAHIIGETLGGLIGLEFAFRHPERVKTIASFSSLYRFKGIPKFLKDRETIKAVGVEAWARATSLNRVATEERDWYMQEMGRTPQHVMLDLLAYLSTVDRTEMLGRIQAPVLIMVGQHARENTHERGRGQADLLLNGRFVEVSNVAEFAHLVEPERCFEIWRDFVMQTANKRKNTKEGSWNS